MIFSHGLGGNRHAYSHIAGSMASHGMVVFCPEHRDGSAAVSFIRDPAVQDKYFSRNSRRSVPYIKIPHDQNDETWRARNKQLKIRCWELGLLHEAMLDIDNGRGLHNLSSSTSDAHLSQLASKLDVQDPGSIIFAGHSFGAATIVQFLKSTYYADTPALKAMKEPLFVPAPESRIRAQITPKNISMLLDMWCFPLIAPTTSALYALPLPAYADNDTTAPGGAAILAIESETFFKWKEHLHTKCRILAPDSESPVVSASAFERPRSGVRFPEPNFFYVVNSAHLNQSDFGVLFPWVTKKIFGAEQPERALRLNVRAMLQLARTQGVPVARTWVGDLIDGAGEYAAAAKQQAIEDTASSGNSDAEDSLKPPLEDDDGIHDDKAILDRSGRDVVDHWKRIDIIGMGAESDHSAKGGKPQSMAGESEMENEIEGPANAQPGTTASTAAK